MRHIEQAVAQRIETAANWHTYDAPQTLKEQKMLRKRFGVVYFVDPSDAMAYAKGKGFKVVDQSAGPDAESGPSERDLDFFYEVTDKSDRTVGLIVGTGKEGQAWICPTNQHYKRWEAYQHGHDETATVSPETIKRAEETVKELEEDLKYSRQRMREIKKDTSDSGNIKDQADRIKMINQDLSKARKRLQKLKASK